MITVGNLSLADLQHRLQAGLLSALKPAELLLLDMLVGLWKIMWISCCHVKVVCVLKIRCLLVCVIEWINPTLLLLHSIRSLYVRIWGYFLCGAQWWVLDLRGQMVSSFLVSGFSLEIRFGHHGSDRKAAETRGLSPQWCIKGYYTAFTTKILITNLRLVNSLRGFF